MLIIMIPKVTWIYVLEWLVYDLKDVIVPIVMPLEAHL